MIAGLLTAWQHLVAIATERSSSSSSSCFGCQPALPTLQRDKVDWEDEYATARPLIPAVSMTTDRYDVDDLLAAFIKRDNGNVLNR